MMIRVRAQIKLYSGDGNRKTPFFNGYRPLFDLMEDTKVSGMITLLDRNEFQPGEEGVVEIKFLEANCTEGTKFYFYESKDPLGEGTVIEVLN